jgi:Mlc titration factor MtfA (ptsG expression regulator)
MECPDTMLTWFKNRRREKLLARPFPASWQTALEEQVPYYHKLPPGERDLLRRYMQVFLAEKNFEGCGGLDLTHRERIVIAAYACLLILHRDNDFYSGLYSILVYPAAFIPKRYDPESMAFEEDEEDLHEGESWGAGTVVLSWEDVTMDAEHFDGRNVVLHEFAHQLYDNADHILPGAEASAQWMAVFEKHFEAHVSAVDRGLRTFLDDYGAEDDAEFFSVATEAFFERPVRFRTRHPELYAAFKQYYGQDPAAYFGGTAGSTPAQESTL